MGELSKFTDDNESAPSEDKKDSKPSEERRWVRPPLVPRSLELARDRSVSPEALPPVPPPTLLEQVLGKDVLERERQTEDDEDEDEEKPRSEERPREVGEAVNQVDAKEAAEAPAAERPAETAPAEMREQTAVEADEITSAEEPDDSVLHIRREPEQPTAEYAPISGVEEEDDPIPVIGGGGSTGYGTTPPPPPPPAAPPPAASPNFGPIYNWNAARVPAQINTYNTAPQVPQEQYQVGIKETERQAEKRGLRKGLVAGFITGYVLKAYLANRKRERYEKATEKQLNERDERINQLQREQQQLAERMAARVEDYRQHQESSANRPAGAEAAPGQPKPEALPPQQTKPEEQIFDQEGNEIVLQPGWRVERSAGGYSVVLDEHNRVVHDAIRYGEAFRREQKREQLSDDLFAAVGSGTAVGGSASDQFMTAQPAPAQHDDSRPSLPAPISEHEVDIKHRLPEPRNQLMETIASPWLWTAIALLIIVYFIAALA